jgi:hypothetical protein
MLVAGHWQPLLITGVGFLKVGSVPSTTYGQREVRYLSCFIGWHTVRVVDNTGIDEIGGARVLESLLVSRVVSCFTVW